MWRVEKRTVMVSFALLVVLSFFAYPVLADSYSGSVEVDNVVPTIGQYEAPSIIYARQYVYLNWTVSDNNGKAVIKNSTLELSNGVIIAYDSTTDTFSEIQDIGNYLVLDASGSLRTNLNSTAFRLSARAMFGWNYTKGNIDIVSAKVYDDQGASGSGSKTDWFYFENDLIVYSAGVDHGRVNPNDALTFNGIVYYEGTTIPPASRNSALSFDGVDDYVNCPDSSSLQMDRFTVSAWVKPNSFVAYMEIANKYAGASYGDWYFSFGGASPYNKLRAVIIGADGNYYWVESATSISANTWTNVVLVYNGTIIFYINGVQDANTYVVNQNVLHSTASLAIGGIPSNPNVCFNGIIDEVRLYNRALSATEVSECYRGIYSNESGLVLYLPFDGDTLNHSGQGNDGTTYGATWTTGAYVDINVKVELGGILKQTVGIVNATNGSFTLPNVIAPNKIGNYGYNIYAVTNKNSVENQTVNVIVDRLKIIGGGVSPSSAYMGETVTVWFKAVYEFDNSTFDGTTGKLYLNGSAMEWSIDNARWEFKYTPNTTGQKTFRITAFLDTKYNLTYVNDVIGPQTVTVSAPWYYPLAALLTSVPLLAWEGAGVASVFIIAIVALFRLGIVTVEIEESMEPAEELKRQINELLQPLAKEDRQSIILQRFLHQLLEKNPPPETIKFLQEYLPIIIKDIIEPKEEKDDEKTRKSESDQ